MLTGGLLQRGQHRAVPAAVVPVPVLDRQRPGPAGRRPGLSLAALPTYSDNNSVVTIKLGNCKWSDGSPVTTRDIAFWINLLKVNKGSFAAYIPGEFPDSLKSYKIVDAKTIVLTLNASYNPTWFTYDQLSQITPLPTQAWDKTSATGKVGNFDQTPSGAKAVFNFLTAQSKDIATYGTNPLWKTVDGPWKLVQYQSDGYAKFQSNPAYSGPAKGKLKYFIEQPFTTDTAELNVLRSGYTLDYGYLPEQEASQSGALAAQGYTTVPWQGWGTTYFLMNYQQPQAPGRSSARPTSARPCSRSSTSRVRAAARSRGSATPNYGPVPSQPKNPYSDAYETKGPWPFRPKTAVKLLVGNGWKVKPNGDQHLRQAGHRAGRLRRGHHGRHPAELHASSTAAARW